MIETFHYLEMVDSDEVWEERQNVLNVEQWALVEKLHGLLDVLVLLDHVSGWM